MCAALCLTQPLEGSVLVRLPNYFWKAVYFTKLTPRPYLPVLGSQATTERAHLPSVVAHCGVGQLCVLVGHIRKDSHLGRMTFDTTGECELRVGPLFKKCLYEHSASSHEMD